MNDKAFDKMMEQKRKEASKPGYGARCAAQLNKVCKTRTAGDQNIQELMLS